MIKSRNLLLPFLLCLVFALIPLFSTGVSAEDANYLTFTAQEAKSTVTFNWLSGSDVMIRVGSTDVEIGDNKASDTNWVNYTAGTKITLTKDNDYVQFKGKNVTTGEDESTESVKNFSMTGKISASGDVTSLTNGVGGDATLSDSCYLFMFYNCTALTTAPALPSQTLAATCYYAMFYGCTALTAAPELPAKTLTDGCYAFMFGGCTSLKTAPELPAKTLTDSCYYGMFETCTSLVTAPDLPAKTLADDCYNMMFIYCTSLASAPELPASVLEERCYYLMFSCCFSLATAPELPASVLEERCYYQMFYMCTSLTAPAMMDNVTTIANDYCDESKSKPVYQGCCENMYSGCTSLKIYETSKEGYARPWSVTPVESITEDQENWANNMFKDCGENDNDAFKGTPTAGKIYYIVGEYIKGDLLTFTANADNSSVTFNYASGTNAQYRINGDIWINCKAAGDTDGTTVTLTDKDDFVEFRGKDITTDEDYHISMSGSIAASGDVTSLTNRIGGDATLTEYCYEYMFYGCDSLTTAPDLPSTELESSCYSYMFEGCTSLTTAPDLPATTLADFCYESMFCDCISLINPPALPATTLAKDCYREMFCGCSSLISIPALPATTLSEECYKSMFEGCESLVAAPALPATRLAKHCYNSMFSDCTSLKTAPCLPAVALTRECYAYMFSGCTSLIAPAMINHVTAIAKDSCSNMYNGCTSLKIYDTATVSENYTRVWKATSSGDSTTKWATNMFTGCGNSVAPTTGGEYYIKATSNDFANAKYYASLTLNNDININLKISGLGTDFTTDKLNNLKVYVNGKAVNNLSLKASDITGDTANQMISCVLKEVPPDEIGDNITVTIAYNNININDFNYSIRSYCEKVFELYGSAESGTKNAKLCDLCKATLNYGAYADIYFNNKAESTINADYNETTIDNIADVTVPDPDYVNSPVSDITVYTNLALGSKTTLNFKLDTARNDINRSLFRINDTDVAESSIKSDATYEYIISISDIGASDLCKSFTLTNTGISDFSITYGVYGYCYTVTNGKYDESLQNLCKAIYNYGEAAKAYSTHVE